MTKHQQKLKDPFTKKRRKTFKDHSKTYKKVYYPYLPAILIFVLSLSVFLTTSRSTEQVLNAATDISASRLLEETNEERAQSGSFELKFNELLGTAAQNKAEDMAKRDYWSHTAPDGKQPWQFITNQGYNYSVASENLAFGFDSAPEAIDAWMKSESHKKAMLDNSVSEVGFGISTSLDYQQKGAQTIIVAMYASPQSPAGIANIGEQLSAQDEQKVTFAQSISGFNNSATTFIVGGLAGGLIVFIFAKNVVLIRKKYRQGKKFILHHPAYDLTALSVVVLLVVLSRTSGFIQ